MVVKGQGLLNMRDKKGLNMIESVNRTFLIAKSMCAYYVCTMQMLKKLKLF